VSSIDPRFALFRLGTEQGGNIKLWRYAVDLQAQRVRDAIAQEHERDADRQRVDVDGHFLLVAMRNGLRFATQLQRLAPDDGLLTALGDFVDQFPQAHDMRDVFTHLDEYLLDEGRLQPSEDPKRKHKRRGEVERGSFSWRARMQDGDVLVVFGPFALPLLAVADAAAEVMRVADDVWLQAIRDNRDALDDDREPDA
jgi:hypothetical protein